ncbi:hypothetical protein OAY92_01405 [Alphaproteobacteria bacterium]|nr:hypothetical protein [Alphaproteobacteria bacterium]
MDKKTQKHQLSFADAFTFLKKFRYKPRNEWTKEERTIFKICNFIVLSKKRINKIFLAFSSLAKLSDKSHYNYNEIDILKIKDLLLQSLEETLQKFNKKIKLFKEEDISIVQEHLKKLKDENLRLENENKRLNFVIANYIRENELLEIDEVKEILSKKNIKEKFKKSQKTGSYREKNMKKFIEKWKKGLTTFEINEEIINENLAVEKELKKKVKL